MISLKQLFKNISLSVLILMTISTGLVSQSDDQTIVFTFGKTEYRVTVRVDSEDVSDILLTPEGQPPRNLSALLPGLNLSPVVNLSPDEKRFMVTWFQYRAGDMQLCVYDSVNGLSRLLPLNNFKSVYPIQTVFFDDLPQLILFKGNNTNNTDIFYYHLASGQVRNITSSPHSDQEWEIIDEPNRVFIETNTLYHHSRYRLKKSTLKIKQTKQVEIVRERPESAAIDEPRAVNTVVGFGDSITWGLMRMDITNPLDYEHPEMAYLKQLEEMISAEYSTIDTVNLGIPGNHTWQAIDRMEDEFEGLNALFCIVMLGTNDVARRRFDVDESIENLEYIVTELREEYGMYPIMTTVPPQKDEQNGPRGVQAHKQNTLALNARIIELATRLEIPFIRAYSAFLSGQYHWEELLEAFRGNHPSPLGHKILAQLFRVKLLEAPPLPPENIDEFNRTETSVTFHWDSNREFDFSHYRIQFGYSPSGLNRSVTTAETFYRFIPYPLASPFDKKIYFRIQAVDLGGNGGEFSLVQSFEFDD